MRRNSSDLRYIGYAFSIILLFAYEIATAKYIFLPPLFGVFFTYMIFEYSRKRRTYMDLNFGWYLSIAFLLFAEQVHGFHIFSSIIAFFVFFYILVEWLFSTLKYRITLLAIFVSVGYIGTYGVSSFVSYMLNENYLYFDREYIAYIWIEFLISIILFKERIV
ncbi:MAG: hypothetical protein K5978_02470 [Campylobacter sp.]|nr:hypothetical protein [Campylobacter sp.]